MTIEIILGQDELFNNKASGGEAGEDGVGLPGVSSDAVAKPNKSPSPEAHAYVWSGIQTVYAEVWQEFLVSGHYPVDTEISLSGFWSAEAFANAGTSAGVQIDLFVRTTGDNQEKTIIEETLNPLFFYSTWADEDTYWNTLSINIEPGLYEMGMRVTTTVEEEDVLQPPTGADIHRDEFDPDRFASMAHIDIEYQEVVNPFFDGTDLQNPKDTAEVHTLIVDWSDTEEIDGIEYNREEVIEHLDKWDVLWEIVTDQNEPVDEITSDDISDALNSYQNNLDLCSPAGCIKDGLSLNQLQIVGVMYDTKANSSLEDIDMPDSIVLA